jgi:hypothetical protein
MLEFSEMKYVSMATGGEDDDYCMVAYIGKTRGGARCEGVLAGVGGKDQISPPPPSPKACHVFNCGEYSDEVLETMGQAFMLSQGDGAEEGTPIRSYDHVAPRGLPSPVGIWVKPRLFNSSAALTVQAQRERGGLWLRGFAWRWSGELLVGEGRRKP